MSRGSNLEDFVCVFSLLSLPPVLNQKTDCFVMGLQPSVFFSSTFYLTPCPQLTSLTDNVVSDVPSTSVVQRIRTWTHNVLHLIFPCLKLFMNRTGFEEELEGPRRTVRWLQKLWTSRLQRSRPPRESHITDGGSDGQGDQEESQESSTWRRQRLRHAHTHACKRRCPPTHTRTYCTLTQRAPSY